MEKIKFIKLTREQYAIVDESDFDRLLSLDTWYFNPNGNHFYARSSSNRGMHRIVLNINDRRLIVDHINHDGLDNRKCNLRIATKSLNRVNTKIPPKGWSFRHRKNPSKPYSSQIQVNKKKMHLGSFKTKNEAIKAYNDARKKYFGDFHSEVPFIE